ncbi:T9SS type A sorting domain-containing protein [Fulvivirga lutimaris]|uniref:T9SS type A sorting domain-containing protein n=1 Tax=Fulvivirga lutimaris TaxID=1819566 RepID=UPI0012BBCF8C|nr:T9SS type A sorting domain-containing protein [Fulvivirga lutimaris]MTI39224.1 T9SS type A sorting domain-containing protein [Fulvivirga lutimaris]
MRKLQLVDISINAIVFLCLFFCSNTSHGQFVGDYDQENWDFISQGPLGESTDGSIDLTNMPSRLTITGSNDEVSAATTDYSIQINTTGTIKFAWLYDTDDGPEYDKAGYKINGQFYELTDPGAGSPQEGELAVEVTAGDTFAFSVDATDACCGRGYLTIQKFSTADNTPPTIDQVENYYLGVNPGEIVVGLTGISPGILESDQELTVQAQSSNSTVIVDPVVSYTSPDDFASITFTPELNAYGNTIITVTVMDDGGTANGSTDLITMEFMVSIADNFPPTINNVDPLVLEINQNLIFDLSGITAGQGESQDMTVTATSSNQSLIPDINIGVAYLSPGNTGQISLSPLQNVAGELFITVIVSDNGTTNNNGDNQTEIQIPVQINSNVSPTIDEVFDIELFVDGNTETIDLFGISIGEDIVSQDLTIEATSNNTALIANPIINYTSPDNFGSLELTPIAGQSGEAIITVTVSDNAGVSGGGIDQQAITFNVIVRGNYQPQISPISNITMGINEPLREIDLNQISGGVITNGDVIALTATSSNSAVIAPEGITVDYTSPNSFGVLGLTPVTDVIGETIITVTVMDDQGTANNGENTREEKFVVKVIPNRRPLIDRVADLNLDINPGVIDVNLSGISAGEFDEYQELTITATSNNLALIPNPSITYSSPDGVGTLSFTPELNAIGDASITLTITDNGGDQFGGVNTYSSSFNVNIIGNQAPTLNDIDDQVLTLGENRDVIIEGITDGFNNTQDITITAVSNNVSLVPNPIINYVNGEPNGILTIQGDAYGQATITVTIMDNGGTANGGIDELIRTFKVDVSGNTPPVVTDSNTGDPFNPGIVTVNSGSSGKVLLFQVEDADHTVVSASVNIFNPAFSSFINAFFTSGSFLGSIKIETPEGVVGTTEVTLSVSDDGGVDDNGIDTREINLQVISNQTFYYDGIIDKFTEYHIEAFSVEEDGYALIKNTDSNLTGGTLSLYKNSFNPNDFAENRIADVTLEEEIYQYLESGTIYQLVLVSSDVNKSFTNEIGILHGSVNYGYTPYINDIVNVQPIDEDSQGEVVLTGISDGNGSTDNLLLSVTTDSPSYFNGLSISDNFDGTAVVNITPDANINGTALITVMVTAPGGASIEKSFVQEINPVNDAPDFTLSEKEHFVTQELRNSPVEISIVQGLVPEDELDQHVIYSLSPPSVDFADIAFETTTGLFTLSNFTSVETELIFTITANDQQPENNTASQSFTLNLSTINTPPIFSVDPSVINITQEERGEAFIAVATPEEVPSNELFQTVTYSISPKTVDFADVSIDSQTGQVTITNIGSFRGAQEFIITADDSQPSSNLSTQTLTVNVSTVNNPPTFTLSTSAVDITRENFVNNINVDVIPDEVPDDEGFQEVVYSITPTTVEFADISFNSQTGSITFSNFLEFNGEQSFTISANDQQPENNIASQILTVNISTILSTEDSNILHGLSMYPNPVTNDLIIKKTGYKIKSINIMDINGLSVFKMHYRSVRILKLDLSHINSGLYIYTVEDEKGNILQGKFIKK